MKNYLFRILALCMVSSPVFSAQLLYKQSFEKPIEESPEIQWTTPGYPITQAIVSDSPQDGQKSVRGNFNATVIDPITKLQGYNFVQLKLNFRKIPALTKNDWYKTTEKVYVSWWFKHDPCLWQGSNYENTDPIRTTGKIAFLRMNEDPATSYYFTMNGGKDGSAALAANSWNNLWQEWYGRPSLWLANGIPWGATGKWHKISFLIGSNDNQKYLMWWVDNKLMKADRFEPDGKNKIYNNFTLDSIQFWHSFKGDMDASVESPEPGVCNGWQIDNIEVWDGLPDEPLPPTPLTPELLKAP
jgi:hypothetical protein